MVDAGWQIARTLPSENRQRRRTLGIADMCGAGFRRIRPSGSTCGVVVRKKEDRVLCQNSAPSCPKTQTNSRLARRAVLIASCPKIVQKYKRTQDRRAGPSPSFIYHYDGERNHQGLGNAFVFLDTTGSMSTWSCSVAITTLSDRTEL